MLKLLYFSFLLLLASPVLMAQATDADSSTHKWELGIQVNQVVFNGHAVPYRQSYAAEVFYYEKGDYKSPIRNFKFNKGSHYYFGVTAARLKGKWFYRMRLDYFYHIHNKEELHYFEPGNRIYEWGSRFIDTGLQLSPGAGRMFDWKFLTFKLGLEIPVYFDWITKERRYQKEYEANNPTGWIEYSTTYPSVGFVKLAATTAVDVRFCKRFSASIELSSGILFYKIKGGVVYNKEYYAANGTLYKTTSEIWEYRVKGNLNYDLLVPSFSLSYRL